MCLPLTGFCVAGSCRSSACFSCSLLSFPEGPAGSGAVLLLVPRAFLSCCSGIVLPSAGTLFCVLSFVSLRGRLYSRPACSSRRLDVGEQEVPPREEKRTCPVSTERRTGAGGALCGPSSVDAAGFVWLCLLSLLTCRFERVFRFTEPPLPSLPPFPLLLLLASPPSSAWAGAQFPPRSVDPGARGSELRGDERVTGPQTSHVWNLPQ